MRTYADFEVWISARPQGAGGGAYRVQVFSSPVGPVGGELNLDLDVADFMSELALVSGIQQDLGRRRAFGERLFTALFDGPVRDAWNGSLGHINASNSGLRVRLWIEVPELARLPWELLHDPNLGFLATASNTVLSRYLPVREPPVLQKHDKLRVLVVVESPAGLPAIEEAEVDRLRAALSGLGAGVEYTVLKNATAAQLHQALQRDYHVLHYLGHGVSRRLVLTAGDGSPAPVDEDQFAQLVQGRGGLRLVFLNACSSSQSEEGGLFGGVGPALIRRGVPAVIAMQYPTVQLSTASEFSEAVYGALANGLPIDVAVNEGRQRLSAGPLLGTRDWSTPVLYMGTRSGRIFDLPQDEAAEVSASWEAVVAAAQQAGVVGSLSELTKRFQEVSARLARLKSLSELGRMLRGLRADFAPCLEHVERAGGVPANLPLPALGNAWRSVRQRSLGELETFMDDKKDRGEQEPGWYTDLFNTKQKVDKDLADLALLALYNDLSNFGEQIAQAETRIGRQHDEEIGTLISYSDQTLGRLSAS